MMAAVAADWPTRGGLWKARGCPPGSWLSHCYDLLLVAVVEDHPSLAHWVCDPAWHTCCVALWYHVLPWLKSSAIVFEGDV